MRVPEFSVGGEPAQGAASHRKVGAGCIALALALTPARLVAHDFEIPGSETLWPGMYDTLRLGDTQAGSPVDLNVGDLNSDGLDDIVLGVPQGRAADGSLHARIIILWGAASGTPLQISCLAPPDAETDVVKFGERVSLVQTSPMSPTDVVVSDYAAFEGHGAVYLYDAGELTASLPRIKVEGSGAAISTCADTAQSLTPLATAVGPAASRCNDGVSLKSLFGRFMDTLTDVDMDGSQEISARYCSNRIAVLNPAHLRRDCPSTSPCTLAIDAPMQRDPGEAALPASREDTLVPLLELVGYPGSVEVTSPEAPGATSTLDTARFGQSVQGRRTADGQAWLAVLGPSVEEVNGAQQGAMAAYFVPEPATLPAVVDLTGSDASVGRVVLPGVGTTFLAEAIWVDDEANAPQLLVASSLSTWRLTPGNIEMLSLDGYLGRDAVHSGMFHGLSQWGLDNEEWVAVSNHQTLSLFEPHRLLLDTNVPAADTFSFDAKSIKVTTAQMIESPRRDLLTLTVEKTQQEDQEQWALWWLRSAYDLYDRDGDCLISAPWLPPGSDLSHNYALDPLRSCPRLPGEPLGGLEIDRGGDCNDSDPGVQLGSRLSTDNDQDGFGDPASLSLPYGDAHCAFLCPGESIPLGCALDARDCDDEREGGGDEVYPGSPINRCDGRDYTCSCVSDPTLCDERGQLISEAIDPETGLRPCQWETWARDAEGRRPSEEGCASGTTQDLAMMLMVFAVWRPRRRRIKANPHPVNDGKNRNGGPHAAQ